MSRTIVGSPAYARNFSANFFSSFASFGEITNMQ
jgi:hypothetical protein